MFEKFSGMFRNEAAQRQEMEAELAELKKRREGLRMCAGQRAATREDGQLIDELNANIAQLQKSLESNDQQDAA